MLGHGGLAVPVCSLLLLQLPVLPVTARRSAEEETFRWWGEWSSWSSCSRSCGGGVRSQERHCLIQRLSSTQNVNSLYCVGSPKQYQLCSQQLCITTSISFKQHQCSQFNSKAFGGRYYQWIPLYPADYISISNKPCDLQCTSVSGERQLLVPAGDGTFCRDAKHRGVCIEGACQPVGCDGHLYSSKTVDRCGVCGGKGTSCQRITGSYRTALTQLGYAFITNIPAGSSDIQIIERHKTENILALSDEQGHFFFNGNTAFDRPQNFHVAGTVFKYRRPSSLLSHGLEYIIAQGPTLQGLHVMYYNLNGKLPHITYEYTVPLSTDLSTGSAHSHSNHTFNVVNKGVGGGGTTGAAHDYDPHTEGEEPVWETPTPSPPLPPAGLLLFRPADVTSHVLIHNNVEQHAPPAPPGYRAPSVQSAGASHRDLELLRPHNYPDNQTLSHGSRHTLTNPRINTDRHVHTQDERESKPDVPQVTLVYEESDRPEAAVQAAMAESNDFNDGLEPHIGVADMYRWKVSAYAPCSATCTTGISSSFALCVRYDGAEVDDGYCDSLSRPEPTHEFCSGKECPPRWETSGWSACSRTCGEGIQFRTVRCWKMLSPGLDSSVYDSLCLSHDLHKPANRKVCHGQSCGPQWEVSDWSQCSARCGNRGFRTREVRCSMETKLCNVTSQPIESQECEGPPCDRRWTVSDWGPCSGVCGEGRMIRALTCRSSGGSVISEDQCDQSLRPLAIHPCGDRDCAPHWVEQEWQQCNATCGRGMRLRQVVCAGLEGGVFKEFPESNCNPTSKPEGASPCFQRPCSKWFTTSWSQCSKTCGSGFQVREVKCYQGDDLVTRGQSCDSSLRPDARQSCEVQSCATDSPASISVDDPCQDKPTANCALVLKVKLCSHWYYRKACCQSCRTPKA